MTNTNCIRVMSVDDHPLIREGIGTIITGQTDMSLAGTASNGRERIEAFRALQQVALPDDRRSPVSGGPVVLLGYPTALDAKLARAGAETLQSIGNRIQR
jgi:chemotaxis response regulator CheB